MHTSDVSSLVSVVIPTYNRVSLLKDAIESVRMQTYNNWELVIVDDGSTDGTVDEIKNINDRRIKLITLSHTGNISILRNIGAKESKGEWLAFLDSDDVWMPEKLVLQMEMLSKEKKRWIYGPYKYVDQNKKIIYTSDERFTSFSGNIIKEVILAKTGITICSVVIKKDLFNEIGGFSSGFKIKGDYEFLLRLSLKAEAAVTNEIVLQVTDHSSRTYTSANYSYELSASVYKYFIALNPARGLKKLARRRVAFFLSEASVHRFSTGNYRIALQQLGQSIWMKDTPRHWLSALKRGIWSL